MTKIIDCFIFYNELKMLKLTELYDTVDYFRDKYGWTWLNQDEDAWKKVNPKIAAKIEQLEMRIEDLETEIQEKL